MNAAFKKIKDVPTIMLMLRFCFFLLSYEVDSELDLNWPHSTVDANGVNQLYYYYYNLDIAKDYKRNVSVILCKWPFSNY